MSFHDLEMKVIQWAERDGIVPRECPQVTAAMVNSYSLRLMNSACVKERRQSQEIVGNMVIGLIVYCALKDIDLAECLALELGKLVAPTTRRLPVEVTPA